MRKELNKPENMDVSGAGEKDDPSFKHPPQGYSPYGEIDTETDGIEVGLITTVKYEFKKDGDRLVGYLASRRTISMPDNPVVYEVLNTDGDWSFWGSRLLNGRLDEVPDKVFLDITYLGWRQGTTGGRKYKDYTIKYYVPPEGFEPERLRITLSPDGKKIVFLDWEKPHPPDGIHEA